MKKLLVRIAIILVVLLVLAVVVVGLFLGSIVKKGVETVGPALTKTEMKLDGASLSFLSGSGGIKGLVVGNPEGYKTPSAIKVGSASLGVKPMSVFADKVHVTHVRIEAPDITFEGKGLKENNLSKILENVEAASGGPSSDKQEPKGASRKLQVDEVSVTGGKIHLSATFLGGKAMTLPLPDIQMKDLGQGPEGITAAELTKRLLSEVTANTLKAVQQGVGDLGKGALDAVNDATKGAPEGVKDATKSIGNLFKKK
jgi:uncharacterized protein involved in outer membrane biogenesis